MEATPHSVSLGGITASACPGGAPQDFEEAMRELATAIMRAAQTLNACTSSAAAVAKAEAPSLAEMGKTVFSANVSVALGAQKTLDLGPIAALMHDETINDILINGPKQIFVERAGKICKTEFSFPDHQSLYDLAVNIAAAVGRRLDPKRPLVDARLADGSRVNIIAPPLAVDGTSISIRKFSRDRITLDRMVETGCMSRQLAAFLKAAARAKLNIVICGGTGSGKTTLLNAISQYVGADERIVTIEDSAELQLQQPHVVRLETREADAAEGGGAREAGVSMRDLVKNALRMRPDRIIVGESRGEEAFDMIQAMNTGHDGSLTTIHANTPRDALARMENMVSMANLNIPVAAMRKQIVSAVHLMVQTARMEDGMRRVTEITELVGMEGEVPSMQELFKFKTQGMGADGRLKGQHLWSNVFPRHNALTLLLRESGAFKL
jgi:pilus assembly protein CpaF